MPTHSIPQSGATAELDWGRARQLLRRYVAMNLGAGEESHLDDLVQEACVRLLRASRREAPRDLETLCATIARRTWKDFLKRRIRARAVFAAVEIADVEQPDPRSLRDPLLGDVLQRLEQIVLEVFRRHGAADCAELARDYFDAHDWAEVARRRGSSHAAVRKRWSRCVELPRRSIAADSELRRLVFWEYLQGGALR
jgi:DNA-directed RNA polymerase specialized sigma24 family protein